MMAAWSWLMLAVAGSTGGNLLMKYASQANREALTVYLSVQFLLGAVLFGGGLLCYVRALQLLPLSVAYPALVGASIFLTSICSVLLFSERMSAVHIVGVIFIFAGLFLLTRHASIA